MTYALIFIGGEQYEEREVKRGGNATLYFLTETLVGKFMGNGGRGILRNDQAARRELQGEADIAQLLHENGFPVARPYGVHDIGLHYFSRANGQRVTEKFPCFVQDFLDFPQLAELDYASRIEGMVKAKKVIARPREDFGLQAARDVLSERNILFNPKTREIRLVDFAEWIFEGM